MITLPNPFSSAASDAAAEMAAASSATPASDAAADNRFVLDEEAFFEAIEPVPLFLRPVIELLAGF